MKKKSKLHVTATGCPLATLSVSQLNITTGLPVSYCEGKAPDLPSRIISQGAVHASGFIWYDWIILWLQAWTKVLFRATWTKYVTSLASRGNSGRVFRLFSLVRFHPRRESGRLSAVDRPVCRRGGSRTVGAPDSLLCTKTLMFISGVFHSQTDSIHCPSIFGWFRCCFSWIMARVSDD